VVPTPKERIACKRSNEHDFYRSLELKTKVSFWLIPSEEDRVFFQAIIDTISQEYDAPAFTPHVTIDSGEYAHNESPA
jgi:hypothetical protein